MIRAVTVGSLLGLLLLVLYLPSAHRPERFLAHLREEHRSIAQFWGDAPAQRILTRAIGMQDSARSAAPLPSAADAPDAGAVTSAVAAEMANVNRRLFDNAYFRSIDALLLLAAYRLATLLQWLPWLLTFAFAALADGYVVRLIKAKEFRQHDPEVYAIHACAAIVTICAAVVGLVVPVTLHPLVMPCVPLLVSVLAGRAVGSFHRRG